jgi:hypothetical protein
VGFSQGLEPENLAHLAGSVTWYLLQWYFASNRDTTAQYVV